jgi:hypothetical protein
MPEECLHWIRQVGDELAKAQALKAYEEENRKTVLAALKLKQNVKSDAGAETKARASDEWQQYLAEYQEAILNEAYYRHQLNWLHVKMEAWRSKNANNRREFKNYGN